MQQKNIRRNAILGHHSVPAFCIFLSTTKHEWNNFVSFFFISQLLADNKTFIIYFIGTRVPFFPFSAGRKSSRWHVALL